MDLTYYEKRCKKGLTVLEDFEFIYRIPYMLCVLEKITGDKEYMKKCKDLSFVQRFSNVSIYSYLELPKRYGGVIKDDIYADFHATSMNDLIRIEGLASGVGTWYENAKTLFKDGKGSFNEYVAVKEDISTLLHYKGMPLDEALIVENDVSCGDVALGRSVKWDRLVDKMKCCDVSDWYIWSLKNIIHLYSYAEMEDRVIMQLQLAYFKENYEKEYQKVFEGSNVENYLYA